MYTEEQLDKLEQEQHSITTEALMLMILSLDSLHADLKKELTDFYREYGKDGVVTYKEARKWIGEKNHTRRLTALLTLLNTKFNKIYLNELEPEFRSFLTKVIGTESDFFDVDLNADDLLEESWGVDEATWLTRLKDDVALWVIYLGNDIKRSLLRRDNLNKVMEQIDKRFTTIEHVLTNLCVTESTAYGSISRRKVMKELGVVKYQFFTRADERTCDVCGSMHGLIFPISSYEVGVTASPLHPRCRCWEVPIRE